MQTRIDRLVDSRKGRRATRATRSRDIRHRSVLAIPWRGKLVSSCPPDLPAASTGRPHLAFEGEIQTTPRRSLPSLSCICSSCQLISTFPSICGPPQYRLPFASPTITTESQHPFFGNHRMPSTNSYSCLDRVRFSLLSWRRSTQSAPSGASFPLPVKHVQIVTKDELGIAFALCPRLVDSLESFDFLNLNSSDRTDLCALPGNVGRNLRNLSLNFIFFARRNLGSLATYSDSSHGPSLPPQAFSSFPHLETLNLTGSHGPSLQLFETLLGGSPFLRIIGLGGCHWISYSNPASADSDDIFPEAQLSFVLSKLVHLEFLHLGTLPTIDPFRYEALRLELQQGGIRTEYAICQQA